MTTLASTTAMTAHLRQPAPAFIDHEIGRGFMGSPPTAHGDFSEPCPLTEGKRPSFSPSGERLDVSAGYHESIATLSRRESAGPDPATNRLRCTAAQRRRRLDIELVT